VPNSQPVGEILASVFGVYTLSLLLLTPVHVGALLVLAYRSVRRQQTSARLHLAVDVVYGLANPFLYLLVLDRMVAGRWPGPLLTDAGAAALAGGLRVRT